MNSDYPPPTAEIARKRRELAPAQQAAFDAFGKAVFGDGALTTKTKQIIAVAVAHPRCMRDSGEMPKFFGRGKRLNKVARGT